MSFLLAHVVIAQPIWKVVEPKCSPLHKVQSRFELGSWQIL